MYFSTSVLKDNCSGLCRLNTFSLMDFICLQILLYNTSTLPGAGVDILMFWCFMLSFIFLLSQSCVNLVYNCLVYQGKVCLNIAF